MDTKKEKLKEIKKFVIEQIKDPENYWDYDEYRKYYKSENINICYGGTLNGTGDKYIIELRSNPYNSTSFSIADIGLSRYKMRRLINNYIIKSLIQREKDSKFDKIFGDFDRIVDSNKQLKRNRNLNKVLVMVNNDEIRNIIELIIDERIKNKSLELGWYGDIIEYEISSYKLVNNIYKMILYYNDDNGLPYQKYVELEKYEVFSRIRDSKLNELL